MFVTAGRRVGTARPVLVEADPAPKTSDPARRAASARPGAAAVPARGSDRPSGDPIVGLPKTRLWLTLGEGSASDPAGSPKRSGASLTRGPARRCLAAIRIAGLDLGGCEFCPFRNSLYYMRQLDFLMSAAHACQQTTSDGQYGRKSSDDADSRSTLRARVHRIYLSAPVDAQAGAEV